MKNFGAVLIHLQKVLVAAFVLYLPICGGAYAAIILDHSNAPFSIFVDINSSKASFEINRSNGSSFGFDPRLGTLLVDRMNIVLRQSVAPLQVIRGDVPTSGVVAEFQIDTEMSFGGRLQSLFPLKRTVDCTVHPTFNVGCTGNYRSDSVYGEISFDIDTFGSSDGTGLQVTIDPTVIDGTGTFQGTYNFEGEVSLLRSYHMNIQFFLDQAERHKRIADIDLALKYLGCTGGVLSCLKEFVPGLAPDSVQNYLIPAILLVDTALAIRSGSLGAMTLASIGVVVYGAHLIEEKSRQLANDPPRFDYDTVATYSGQVSNTDFGLGADLNAYLNGLLTAQNFLYETLSHSLTSLERAQGAEIDGQTNARDQNFAAFNFFQSNLFKAQNDLGAWLVNLPTVLANINQDDILLDDGSSLFGLFSSYGASLNEVAIENPIIPTVTSQTSPPSIPEPATITLFGLGLLGFGFARRRNLQAA